MPIAAGACFELEDGRGGKPRDEPVYTAAYDAVTKPSSFNGMPQPAPEPEEDEGLSSRISDRLMTELTSHRTLGPASRARRAAGHRLHRGVACPHAEDLFYHYGSDTPASNSMRRASAFGAQAPGLNDSGSRLEAHDRTRHEGWAEASLPKGVCRPLG